MDLEDSTVELAERQGFTVPRAVKHRPRAPQRSVILMVEGAGFVPTRADGARKASTLPTPYATACGCHGICIEALQPHLAPEEQIVGPAHRDGPPQMGSRAATQCLLNAKGKARQMVERSVPIGRWAGCRVRGPPPTVSRRNAQMHHKPISPAIHGCSRPRLPRRASRVTWLTAAFGFVERIRIGDGHRTQMSIGENGAVIVANVRDQQEPPHNGVVSHVIRVRVEDVDAQCEQARVDGARVLEPPTQREYGELDCTVVDLAGHRWQFAETVRDVAPEEYGCETVAPWPERLGP